VANIRERRGAKGTSYQARVMIDGKSKVRTFAKRAQAERWALEVEYDNRIRYDKHDKSGGLTFDHCMDRYMKVGNFGRAKLRALEMFRSLFGHMLVSDFTDQHLLEWAEKRALVVSPSTLQSDLSYFNVFWIRCIERYRQPNEVDLVKRVTRWMRDDGKVANSKQRDRRPTQSEIAMLREYWRGSNTLEMPLVDMMDFTLIVGVRVSELCRLRWRDFVDGDQPRILIRDRKDPRKKSGNHEWLPLIGDSAAILRRQPRVRIHNQ